MNDREKNYLTLLVNMGVALMQEARKTSADPDGTHLITFEPETGWVDAYIVIDGKQHHATRFDQFPDIQFETLEVKP